MPAAAPPDAPGQPSSRRVLLLAMALSMGGAVSLGITRFAYGLLLPAMRADLSWSYTLAGAMNTLNAAGYLIGALVMPRLLRRFGPSPTMLWGAVLASLFMGLSGFFTDPVALLTQRLLAGLASALVFVAGGLLAARLGTLAPSRSGLLLGMYYGGTGLGITLSAVVVPLVLEAAHARPHGWAWAWWALALACFAATMLLAWPARVLARLTPSNAAQTAAAGGVRWAPMGAALLGYGLFGAGYIGYMTFVVALLREAGASQNDVMLFYALLGLATFASSRVWAGLLDRCRGGEALALLNVLVGAACLLPALTSAWPAMLLSGIVFGGVMLSVVASTTAFVRHNLPAPLWAAGISAFTIVFAAGQIVGPTAVGWVADGPGGLARGLVISAVALWLGAALAWRQKPLPAVPAAA